MKKYYRAIIFLVLIALFTTAFASCKPDEDDKSGVSGTSTISEAELFGNLPNVNYNDDEIVILVEGDYMSLYKSVEIMQHETSPEIINTAITERNNLVEERFGVKITEVRTTAGGEMSQNIRNNQLGGTNLYDIVMPFIPQAATLSLDGYFYLLNDNDYLDLGADYWDQRAVDGLSINYKNYFAVGDFSLLSLACTHAIVFNKDMIDENDLENPYELVENGTWTLDKLKEMARKVTMDSDGTVGMSYTDTYGFLVNNNFVTSMYIGSGEGLTKKDGNDLPLIAVGSERSFNVFSKIYDLVTDNQATGHIESFSNATSAVGKTVWLAATEAVASKRAMFRAMSIADIPELGEYDCNFGILPIPKYDVSQDEYYSLVSTIYATSAAIPTTNPDFEQAAIILDALCQASTKTVKHSYYQVMLKERKVQDDESEAMLDRIFSNRVYDLGNVFGWGGTSVYDASSISSFMNTVAFSGSNTIVSALESIYDKVQSDIDQTVEQYR